MKSLTETEKNLINEINKNEVLTAINSNHVEFLNHLIKELDNQYIRETIKNHIEMINMKKQLFDSINNTEI
jgi:predicted outer membrane protein